MRATVVVAALAVGPAVLAQQTQPQRPADADAGFERIFDGATLTGWEGDPKYWRVEDGALVGEVTAETVMRQNSFVIWRGGRVGDFELKLEYRISAQGNSGINYRSAEVEGTPFALRGYQCDLDGEDRNRVGTRHTGNNYEERGRTFMALRGQITRADPGGQRTIVGAIGDYVELAQFIRSGDWNEVHIVARGAIVTHLINGHVMCVLVDDDPESRRSEGLLGVQVHSGPPMKIEFRNIRLRRP